MMFQPHPLSVAIKLCLFTIGSTAACSAIAQSETDKIAEEEVVVLGSHIKGLEQDGALQTIEITREDIELSGANSITDLLQDLAVTGGGSGTFSTVNAGANSSSTPVGASAVSLRGLGTSSTLTLINGRRATVSSFAKGSESFVDASTIPLAALERVEVLPSGASAIYGADAVAGVVNYVLRDDFDGAEFTFKHQDSFESSAEVEQSANFIWGFNTDNTNTTIILDWYSEDAFDYSDRQRLLDADPWGSSRSPFVDAWAVGDYGNQGTDADCPFPTQTNFGPECRDRPNNYLQVHGEFESKSAMINFKADLDGTLWFNELLYSSTESAGRSTPITWRLNVATDNPGLQNDPDLVESILNANRDGLDADLGEGTTDALIEGLSNEGGIDDALFELDNFGDGFLRINGRFPEAREFEVKSDTYRLVSGLEGNLKNWDWDVALAWGKNENEQIASQGFYVREQIQHGLLGTLCSDGSILQGEGGRIVDIGDGNTIELDNEPPLSVGGQFIDTGVTCENSGRGTTVWYDPFNGQTAESNNAFKTDALRIGESELLSFDAKISTPNMLSLPGGNVASAFGVEVRKEEVSDVPSGITVANEETNDPVWGYAGTSANYERESMAAFFETVIPIAEDLEFTLAGRYDYFDDFGSDFNPMLRVRYQPIEEFIFRGSWSTSFRAPSLAQAGQGIRLTSASLVCDNLPAGLINPVDGAAPENFCDGIGTDEDRIDGRTAGLNTEELGSADLEPETADTYGFGFMYQPNESIELSVDWWRIDYENLVSVFSADVEQTWIINELTRGNVVVGDSLSNLPSGTPGVLIDDVTGELRDVHFQLFNTGFQNVEGVDIAYTQFLETEGFGRFKFVFDASYLAMFEEKNCDTCEVDQLAGEYTYPRWKANTGVNWRFEGWRTGIYANYTHGYEEDGADDRVGGPTASELEEIGLDVNDLDDVSSWVEWNLNIAYSFANDSYVSLNIDNLFDSDAPRTFSSYDGVDFFNHNVNGRTYSIRVTYAF